MSLTSNSSFLLYRRQCERHKPFRRRGLSCVQKTDEFPILHVSPLSTLASEQIHFPRFSPKKHVVEVTLKPGEMLVRI